MPLFSSDQLFDTFQLPTDELLALPTMTLPELSLGSSFLEDAFGTPPPTRRPVIHIPGIDEIIHIVPESFLPQEVQDQRRRDRARRIAQSPTPELVRSIGSVMTFIDDLNDALLTASVVTRLLAIPFPILSPVAVGLGVASEAINIYGLTRTLGRMALTGKFRANQLQRQIVRSAATRARSATTLARALPNLAESVQILQTTDQLFGVGLSLGPIVGLAQDLIFGLPQGAEFAFQSGIRYKPGDELFLRQEDQDRAEALSLHDPLAAIVAGATPAAWILAAPGPLSFGERLDALVLVSLVAELARGFLPESRWEPILTPALKRDRPATRQLRPKTALEIHRLGIDPHATESYPTQGNPPTLSPAAQTDIIRVQAPSHLLAWLAEAPTKDARIFAETLAADLGFRMIRAFEGPGVSFETHGSPDWRALIDSLELGLLPPRDATDTALASYLTAAAALYTGDLDRPIPVGALRQLHRTHFQKT